MKLLEYRYFLIPTRPILQLLWLFLGISWGGAYAQEAIKLDSGFTSTSLSVRQILLWEDSTGTLNLEDIIRLDEQNQLHSPDKINLGRNFHKHWIKFQVDNKIPNQQLVIQSPMISATLVLYYQQDGTWVKEELHTESFYEQLPIKARVFSFFPKLEEVGSYTFYFKIVSNRVSIRLNKQISTLAHFHNRDIVQEFIFGVLLGGILIMGLYNFFLFLSIRDLNYLYYFITIICNILFQIRLSQHNLFILPYPELWARYGNVFAFLFFSSAIWFSIKFLELQKNNSSLYYLMILFLGLNVLMIPASFWMPIAPVVLVANLSGLLSSLAGLFVGLILLIQRVKIARYYMLAWIFFILGGVFYALTNLGLLPDNVLTSSSKGILIGAFLEVLFLSFALADKINILRKENNAVQKEALAIVQTHAKLIKEQNQMLEEKVNERTQDLQDKNQEILNQNEEILVQAKELTLKSEEIAAQRDYIEDRNKELEHKSNQIRHSLNAALTIQEAVVSYPERLDKLLQDYFLIYHPRDVVSGDFYWLDSIQIPHSPQKVNVLAVVDCTGHGIPGAFMALIGSTLLNKIIKIGKTVDPSTILYRLHQEIRALLRQEESNNNYGMDLSILTWECKDKETFTCTFAGAKRELYYLDAHDGKVHQIKGVRRAIGGVQNENKAFSNHEIQLQKGSVLYLATDGYIDQNNQQRKRFGEKNFLEILKSNAKLPLDIQKYHLEVQLAEHMQGTTQRDDILMIGFRL